MPRTFSLGRLMLGITLSCIVCGWAVNYPEEALHWLGMVTLIAPTIVVGLALLPFSHRPLETMMAAFCGGVLAGGITCLYVAYLILPFTSAWQSWQIYCLFAVPQALGALAFGVIQIRYDPLGGTHQQIDR